LWGVSFEDLYVLKVNNRVLPSFLPKETVTIVDEDDDTVMEDQGLQSARLFS
jgi:hypothetical protein